MPYWYRVLVPNPNAYTEECTHLSVPILAMCFILFWTLKNEIKIDCKLNYTTDGLNNTDKLYIVVVECLLYLFYNSKRLYLLFTNPNPWSFMSSLVATSMNGSVDFLCEGVLWCPV